MGANQVMLKFYTKNLKNISNPLSEEKYPHPKKTFIEEEGNPIWESRNGGNSNSKLIGRPTIPIDYSKTKPEDIEKKMAEFMLIEKEQEEKFGKNKENNIKIGKDEVSNEEARELCKIVVSKLRVLIEKRDITVNEVKLILAITDPRSKDQQEMNTNAEARVPREEVVTAFANLVSGRIPNNRIALKVLAREMEDWFSIDSNQTEITTNDKKDDRISTEPPTKNMPEEWTGYGTLFLITSIPVIITISVVAILFFNSLK